MMSCLSVLPYEVFFDGNQLKMAGIGGVCTYPQHRRKGAVREMFREVLKDMYKRGISFSYLYPFSEKFYMNFGYIPSSQSIRWNFNLNTIPNNYYDGTFHLYRGDGNYSEFETAYKTFAEKYNMMVNRDSYDWEVLKSSNPFKGSRQAYLYKDKAGIPKGYFVFDKLNEPNQIILDCKEMVYDNFTTLKAIMSFVKTFSADYNTVQFNAPRCLSLEYFCEDYSQSKSSRSIRQNGMVRVINVKEVLNHAIFKDSGEMSIKITDSFINQNNGVFHVVYRDGRTKEITFEETGSPGIKEVLPDTSASAKEPMDVDMEMTINQFSAVLVGCYDVTDLDYLEGITLYCNKEKAADFIYKKPCWINNFF
ncbi:GNAT family N-acetyltransferase [Anaerocolumna sedimenticola]|uniref:GNAT family N-acetyltransferase n=1 Tax=Anaerocolumna sedimenticola TaxID=2696063 RepID=A0A6P1TKN1_9FIRM|nr:GNAT family N-acetyltransferase [Anaerocolumna sedimenticola]QHQ60993.1 GNAT family N-acetyltransferase [Anaerocolumna sedimenticola]